MTTENEKLNAALEVVADSVLHGWTLNAKIDYVKQILPDHYTVKQSKEQENIHCKSRIGISDEEQWQYFFQGLKQRFTDFAEVYHNTCHNHVDFTIYFKKQ